MEPGLGIFTPQGAAVAALVGVRITGLVWVAPIFSARSFPAAAKTALTVVLVILLWPVALSAATADVTPITVLGELFIGLTLGLAAAIFIAAAESAGDMLAVQMGLSGANVLDPLSQTQMPILGQVLGLFVTALIVSIGGHVMILRTLGASLDMLPLGTPIDLTQGAMSVVGLGSTLLLLGLRFAAPVVAAMMIGNAALGVLGRTVPQLNLLTVAFPVQIAIGLFMLSVSLPLIAGAFTGWPENYAGLAGDLIAALRPAGGS